MLCKAKVALKEIKATKKKKKKEFLGFFFLFSDHSYGKKLFFIIKTKFFLSKIL